METRVTSHSKEIVISDEKPTVLIGERINPTGKKKLSEALRAGNFDIVREEALAQVEAGADILDINVGTVGVDEIQMLSEVVRLVMDIVDVPLCIDNTNPEALIAALKIYKGKPIINSVTGEERSLGNILPIVKEYKTAVIALLQDDEGIPRSPDQRLAIAHKIVKRAEAAGINREDIIIDCLILPLGAEPRAGRVILETIHRVKNELALNITLGGSNVSFGLPDRGLLNAGFLAIAIAAGVNCPIVDIAKARPITTAADLVLGRDPYAVRYLKAYRQRDSQINSGNSPKSPIS